MSIKDKYFPVLDKGFIALKDVMGSDEDIEQAARVSYGKGTRKKSETRGLIRYLVSHKHTSPLEMVEFKFHVRVPMDCWRQWIRHRTASVNEYSTRYSEAINLCQETQPDKWRLQSAVNKQGSGGYLDDGNTLTIAEETYQDYARFLYRERLAAGVAREQARKDLPLSTYTEAYWKIDLHNLLHFLKLRCDSHAQLEIRSYANVIAGIVKECCPLTFEAWQDYTFEAVTFSRQQLHLLHYYVLNIPSQTEEFATVESMTLIAEQNDVVLSKREIAEFIDKIQFSFGSRFDVNLASAKPYSYFKEEQHETHNTMAEPAS